MELSAPALRCLQSGMAPRPAVRTLLDRGHGIDALKLMARLLPKVYVVAWLCECARDVPLEWNDRAGVALANAWVREPNETHRYAALNFWTADQKRTLGAWLAAASGWSGGSLTPPGAAAVPPPDKMTALAAMAVINKLSMLDSVAFECRREAFIERAIHLLADA
ncbi:DUF6931 family protein [Dyella mobilis]|nr:hypothetical protein [Dyella mobilis]